MFNELASDIGLWSKILQYTKYSIKVVSSDIRIIKKNTKMRAWFYHSMSRQDTLKLSSINK